jgi:uncharacterized protein YycO
MAVIRFVSGKGISSGIIKLGTFSKWSHVDLVTPEGFYLGARLDGGVQARAPGYDGPNADVEFANVWLPPSMEERLWGFVRAQIGKPYDFTAILGIAFRRDWREDDAWFCSELVAAAFEQAGKPLLLGAANRITPRDISMSPYLQGLSWPRVA